MKNQDQDIFEIARELSSTLDLDALLKRIGAACEKLTKASASSIMLLDEEGKNLYFKTATGEKAGRLATLTLPVGEGIAGWCAKERKSAIVNDVAKDKRFTKMLDRLVGFETKSVLCVPMILGEDLIGVAEVLNKRTPGGFSEEDQTVLLGLASLASVAIINARLLEEHKNFFANVLEILVFAIEARDKRMAGHCFRVAQLATATARALGVKGRPYRDLYYASLIHDLGHLETKGLMLADAADGRDEERTHPAKGGEMIQNIKMLKGASALVRYHHENWDGSGPEGLKGESIPLAARILALAEAFDEMRMFGFDAPRAALLIKTSHGKFDSKIIPVFLKERESEAQLERV